MFSGSNNMPAARSFRCRLSWICLIRFRNSDSANGNSLPIIGLGIKLISRALYQSACVDHSHFYNNPFTENLFTEQKYYLVDRSVLRSIASLKTNLSQKFYKLLPLYLWRQALHPDTVLKPWSVLTGGHRHVDMLLPIIKIFSQLFNTVSYFIKYLL